MNDESPGDYGDRAVKEPASKAVDPNFLKYMLDRAEKLLDAASAKRKKKNALRKAGRIPTTLTVNPASKIDVSGFVTHLKNSLLPKKVRNTIHVKNDKVVLSSAIPKGVAHQQWLEDLLSIEEHWELTTGELQFVLKKDLGSFWGSRVFPDLDNEGTYGFYAGPPTSEEPNPKLLPNTTKCWIRPGTPRGTNAGLTVPNFRLVKNKVQGGVDNTALVVLDSKRGLIIVANRAQFYALDSERGCWDMNNFNNFPGRKKNQPKIGRWIIRYALVHELSAHAGLFSRGLPAEHGNTRVEANVKAINALDKKVATDNKNLRDAVNREVNFLTKATGKP